MGIAISFSTIQKIIGRFGYRIIDNRKMPQGDLTTFCKNIFARGFYPQHIIDVGANKGKWSRRVKNVFTNSIFTLIEPQIEMIPYLERFCSEAKGARWINAGAGAKEGELMFTVIPDTVSSSFAIPENEAKKLGFQQRIVPIVTLDHVCKDIIGAVPDLIKLDVEGFEYEVLKGSLTLLGKSELILLELSFFGQHKIAKQVHEIFPIMADFGYHVYDFTWFQHRPYDGALGQCEIAFALTNGSLRSYLSWK